MPQNGQAFCVGERAAKVAERACAMEEQNQKEWTVGLGAVRRAAICAAHVPTSVHDVIQAFATVSPVGVHVNGSETLPCGGVFARLSVMLSVRPRSSTTHRSPHAPKRLGRVGLTTMPTAAPRTPPTATRL